MSKRVSKAAVLGLIEAAIADNYMSPAAKLYRLRYDVQELPTINYSICSEADTISRQKTIDLINRAVTKEAARWGVEELPSAQPEIIRCKDCKQKYLDNMIWNCPFGLPGGEDFFCAYGAKGGDSDDE